MHFNETVNGYRLSVIVRVIALVLCIGALPFLSYAHAGERKSHMDELSYGADVRVQAAYLWRGLYCGGPNIQADANVGFYGVYLDMWWNVGVEDWTFKTFQPEVDFSLGFKRWGLNIYALYIHNFNTGFFDFHNYAGKGNRLELNAKYTISEKIPLTFAWATRIAASDGYINDAGDLVFAYSSYAEISYTQHFKYGLSLYGAVGITPWKSVYSHYQRNFSFNNIDIRLRKDWDVASRCGLMLQGQVSLNPSAIAADKSSVHWDPKDPGMQSVNANLTFGVYLK